MKFKMLYIFNILIILIINSHQSQLRWAFEIFRHGARTPYSGMTPDFKDCFGAQWFGLKELTGIGLRQHFLVGYRNRIKYVNETNLIKPEYDPREVFIISTDSNRTIMSANAQVQGLYPPGTGPQIFQNQSDNAVPPVNIEDIKEEKEKLDEDDFAALPYKMNIIPVHSFFNADHFIQLQDKKVCPTTVEYYKKNQKRKDVVEFLDKMTEKYGDKLQELLINNESRDVLKDYTKAYYIFDTIISRYTEGYELPILNESVTDEMLLNDSFKFFEYDLIGNGIDNDKEICLYAMSPIFDRILKWIDLKIEKDINKEFDYTNYDLPKFVMFSAHDSTCGTFMGFMHAVFGTKIVYPYFATNINLELYLNNPNEVKKDNYYIEYIINDESILNITYNDFVGALKKNMKTMDEINKFCGFTQEKKEENNDDDEALYIWINVGLGIISVILIGLIIFTIKKKKNTNKNIEGLDSLQPFNEDNN